MTDDVGARLLQGDRRARLAAVAELCDRRDDEAADLLDRALDDEHRMVRFRAVEGLGRLGSPRALALLLARMDDPGQSTMTRRFAFNAVVSIGTPAAADALEARMGDYSSRRARRMVARKIAEMRDAHGP